MGVLKSQFDPGLPAVVVRRGVEEAHGYQHPERAVSIHKAPIWDLFSTWYLSESNGECVAGDPRHDRSLGRHLVAAASEEEHLQRLKIVFQRLEKAGLCVLESKCESMVSSVFYFRHQIDEDGLHSLSDKMQAVVEATSPRSVQELKAYLGLLTRCLHSVVLLTEEGVMVAVVS